MASADIRKVLANNARRIAPKKADGTVNTTAFGQATGINTGGAQRILSGEVSVGIDLLQQVARRCGFQAWQLLVPDFDPHAPPRLSGPGAPLIAAESAAQEYTIPGAEPANGLEAQLLRMVRGMSADHRDDLLALANRWYAQDNPQDRAADPFATAAPRKAAKR